MSRFDSRALTFGLVMLVLGGLLLAVAENALVRYAGGIAAFAIGLGAIRRGLRLD